MKYKNFFDVNGGYFGPRYSYGLKQGNPSQTFQITNNILFLLFTFHGIIYYIKKFIKGKIFVYVREKICRHLRQLRPETR